MSSGFLWLSHFLKIRFGVAEGAAGENNGAFILDADPREVGDRKRAYEADAEIGLSWALPHWYDLMTFANGTMGIQCTEHDIKAGVCEHPYTRTLTPVSALSTPRRLVEGASQ